MVSGVGFQSTTDEEQKSSKRKKTFSRGLLAALGVLVVIILIWFGLGFWEKTLNQKKGLIENEITSVNEQIAKGISEEASDFAVRAYLTEDELYKDYEVNDILNEIEDIMILKNSDGSGSRVVLKSFQYNSGSQTSSGKDRAKKGLGSVTLTADADTFDVMAQQIDVFKKSEYFDNVKVGTTDRDEAGRIIFTLTMDVVKNDKSPYEDEVPVSDEDVIMEESLNNDNSMPEENNIENTQDDTESLEEEAFVNSDIDTATTTDTDTTNN